MSNATSLILDIDECAVKNKCLQNTRCINTPGSYRCECADGYQIWKGDNQELGVECKGRFERVY